MSEQETEMQRHREVCCPECGSIEWFPGAACWDCGWEASIHPCCPIIAHADLDPCCLYPEDEDEASASGK